MFALLFWGFLIIFYNYFVFWPPLIFRNLFSSLPLLLISSPLSDLFWPSTYGIFNLIYLIQWFSVLILCFDLTHLLPPHTYFPVLPSPFILCLTIIFSQYFIFPKLIYLLHVYINFSTLFCFDLLVFLPWSRFSFLLSACCFSALFSNFPSRICRVSKKSPGYLRLSSGLLFYLMSSYNLWYNRSLT